MRTFCLRTQIDWTSSQTGTNCSHLNTPKFSTNMKKSCCEFLTRYSKIWQTMRQDTVYILDIFPNHRISWEIVATLLLEQEIRYRNTAILSSFQCRIWGNVCHQIAPLLQQFVWKIVIQPPNSQDLVPSDYRFFS